MVANSHILRGEKFKLAFSPETIYGSDPGTAAYVNAFGVVQSATLPDPAIDMIPIYAMGTASIRDWYTMYKGRISLSGSIPDIFLLNGLPLYLPIGQTVSDGSDPYTHTISETVNLKSFAMHVTNIDSAGTVKLMRRYLGGKCGRMTIEASEGDFLKCSLDDIQFLSFVHDQAGEPFYSGAVSDITVAYPTTQPYLFSYGALTLNNTEFARLRNFRLEINNNLEARYYVTDGAVAQLPYEHREGHREYAMSCNIDVSDATLYKELVRQGSYSNTFRGFAMSLVFTRGASDTITITSPASGSPGAGGDAMGCLIRSAPHAIADAPVVTVPITISMRNLRIVVVDSIATYPGDSSTYSQEFTACLAMPISITEADST